MVSVPNRRYRDKERSSPTESAHKSSGVTVDAPKKSPSSLPTAKLPAKSVPKSNTVAPTSNKKIDMGAASTFGQATDLGINSPTHRNTHDEEDLFDNNNYMPVSSSSSKPPVFKTCPPPSPPSSRNANHQDDFEFNPREDENDFGDFTSAFGSNSNPPPAQSAANVDIFSTDFSGAFSSAPVVPSVASNSLLFDTSAVPLAAPAKPVASNNDISLFGSPLGASNMPNLFGSTAHPLASSSLGGAADLMSDFGGLNMNSPVLSGKYIYCYVK